MSGSNGPADPAALEALKAEAIEAEQQPVEDIEEAAPDTLGAEACGMLAGVAFDLVATRRGEHWRLSEQERQLIGENLDAVLAKYLPGVNMGPEASLAVVLAAVVMPRLRADMQAQGQEADAKAGEADAA